MHTYQHIEAHEGARAQTHTHKRAAGQKTFEEAAAEEEERVGRRKRRRSVETLAVSGVSATVGGNLIGEAALCAAYAIARVPARGFKFRG